MIIYEIFYRMNMEDNFMRYGGTPVYEQALGVYNRLTDVGYNVQIRVDGRVVK